MKKNKERDLPLPLHERLNTAALEMERSAATLLEEFEEHRKAELILEPERTEHAPDVECLQTSAKGTMAIANLLAEASATAQLWAQFAGDDETADVVGARCVITRESMARSKDPMGLIDQALDDLRKHFVDAFEVSTVGESREVNLRIVGGRAREADFQSRSEDDWFALHRWMWEHSHVRGTLQAMVEGMQASLFVDQLTPEKESCIVVRTINRMHAPDLVEAITDLLRDSEAWGGSVVIGVERGEIIRKLGRKVCREAGLTS